MIAKKRTPKKQVTRVPNAKPTASRVPMKQSGPVVALPNGSTVGLRDIGKVKPTPKPTVMKPKQYTPSQYDAILRKAAAAARKKKK